LLKHLPQLEIRVNHPVGESFTTDTDTFKYTVTGELVHHQVRIDETWERSDTLNGAMAIINLIKPLS
jgi:hypothetical protein